MAETDNKADDRGAQANSAKAHKRNPIQFFNKKLDEHRAIVERAKPDIAPADVNCIEEIIKIGRVEMRAIRFIPKEKIEEKGATDFLVDGTAFVANGINFSKTIASHLCFRSKKQVILLLTLLSPEYTVIQAKQYAFRLVQHYVANAKQYHINPNNMSLIGYSTGASYVDTIDTLGSRIGIRFKKKILVSPLMDLTGFTEKNPKYRPYKKLADRDDHISKQFIDYFVNLAVSKEDRGNPIVSPMWQKRATETETEIIVGEHDRLLQQSIALYDLRKSKGVRISLVIVKDGTHAMFWRQFATVYLAADQSKIFKMEGEYSVHISENNLDYEIITPQKRLSS